MKCDSQALFSTHTFANHYLGHKPKISFCLNGKCVQMIGHILAVQHCVDLGMNNSKFVQL
jgi:hypothetical protein